MVTDDERRRVAERLRSLYADSHTRSTYSYWDLGQALGMDWRPDSSACAMKMAMLVRLIDLIDPDTTSVTTKAPKSSETTPTSSDTSATHTDASATCDVSQSRRSGVDREALLALADELDDCGLEGWACGPVHVGDFARRIREACGEGTS